LGLAGSPQGRDKPGPERGSGRGSPAISGSVARAAGTDWAGGPGTPGGPGVAHRPGGGGRSAHWRCGCGGSL